MVKMQAKSVIHVVATECPPEMEKKFHKWYNEKHVPDMLKCKKVKKVTRFKNLHPDGEFPTFLSVYEFDNREDFEEYYVSPERNAGFKDADNMKKELGYSAKRAQYEVIKTWQR